MKQKALKLLAMALSVVMILGLMPITASAAMGTMDIGGNTGYDLSSNQGALRLYGWAWDASSNTINLNSIYTGEYIFISCNSTDTIKLEYSGDVTISGSIHCDGSLEISGNGTLTVNASTYYAAISAAGNITISGGTITATGGNCGINSGGSTTISGGTVTASGGNCGIYSYQGSTTISGGTITAEGGTYDINGKVVITGGSVNLKNKSFSSQPTDGTDNVYLNTLTVGSSANANAAVTALNVPNLSYTYGINDVYTDSAGIIYVWLPKDSSSSASVSAIVDGDTYSAAWTRTGETETKTLFKYPYEVTFESNGGSEITSQDITFNGTVSKPADPTREGYTFGGWYTDNETFANAWDFTSVVTEPITLYAKWTDSTPPTGEITIKDSKWTSFLNTITFGMFFKNSVDITIEGQDLESGVDSIEYFLSDETLPDTTNWDTVVWVSGDKASVTSNWKGVVYARITDKQGNQTVISSDGLVIYTDSKQGTASISFTKTDTTDVTASVELNGNTVAEITNGNYTLKSDTDYTLDNENGVITFNADYLNSLAEGDYTLTVSYNPMGLTYVEGTENDAPATTSINLTVTRASQSISVVSTMTKTFGDPEFKINPTAQGNPEFTFESSDTNVATIAADGTITIIGAGETTITIKAAATDDYKAAETSFKLTVEKAENTITNITSLNKTYGDENFTVEPQANENPVFSFTSSNPQVVSIDKTTGEATVAGAGSATITVSAEETANYKAASAALSVNVAKTDGQVIYGISDYVKTYGDESFTLTPSGYENPVFTFTSSNTNVATVDLNTGEVTIVRAGMAEITVTAAATDNYAGTSAVYIVTVNKAEQTLSGLHDLIKVNGKDSFTVMPISNATAENPIISYQSSDVSVIDFEDRNFVIKGVGTATITVLAGETTNYYSTTSTFDIQVLADTADLEDIIAAAENLLNGLASDDIGDGDSQYPQTAVDELKQAITAAKDVADKENVTQKEVDEAKADLLKAIDDFQDSLIQVDFSELDDAINQAESLSESDYTTATWGILEDALLAGKTTRETKWVTKTKVDDAAQAILDAIAALVDLDIMPPTGEITIKDNQWTSFLNTTTYGLFYKDSVDITITAEDQESGVADVAYYLSDETLPDTTDWNDIDWSSIDLSEIDQATGAKISVTANWKGVVYARITDNQGNQTIINSDGLIIYTDSQQDTESIGFTRTDTADVTASVILNGNKVSGITNGGYTLKADTDYTVNQETGEITFKADYLNTLTEGSYTLIVSYNPFGSIYTGGQGNEAPGTTSIKLTVTRASQDISGVSGMTKTYGDSDFKITPSAQGNPVFTFESSDINIATITEDGTITITGAGETTIIIKAAATDDYAAAETSFKLTVEKAANTITNLASVNKTYGDENFTVEPLANENPVFSFTSSNPEVVSIDQSTGEAAITGTGSAVITVSASATANYKAASAVFSVNVAKADGQVISGLGDYEKTYGDEAFFLTPSAYEAPVFTYASSNTNVAAIDESTGEVTIVGAGIAVITVTASATGSYVKTSAQCVITVDKAEQIVSGLQNLIKVNGGDSFTVTPVTNAAAENPIISYQSSNVSVIDFDADGSFVIKGAGTATITVLAGETANFKSAAGTFDITVLEAESGLDSLEETITTAEDLVNGLDNEQIGDGDGQYPQDAVDELQDAINKAKEVAEDNNAEQEEINQAKEDLLNAIEEFENSLIRVDFSELDNAINQGSILNESDYTAKSWEALENALLAGKTIREAKGVTQAEADAAAEEIFAAIAALESVYQFTAGFETFTGSGSVTATVDAPYNKFVSLTVGGVLLDQDSYTVTEGSTVITLKETYLKTLANGTYAVTAAFTDGTAVTTLTVNVSEAKSVTGVTLDSSNAKVTVGKTLKLTAAVIPSDASNQNLIWSSSDTSIAVVDANGKVTGIKAGSVTITVTTEDGGYTEACTVTVTAAADSSGSDTSLDTQDTAKTGDNQSIGLLISLLGASVLVLLLLGIYLKRKGKLSIGKRK